VKYNNQTYNNIIEFNLKLLIVIYVEKWFDCKKNWKLYKNLYILTYKIRKKRKVFCKINKAENYIKN